MLPVDIKAKRTLVSAMGRSSSQTVLLVQRSVCVNKTILKNVKDCCKEERNNQFSTPLADRMRNNGLKLQ